MTQRSDQLQTPGKGAAAKVPGKPTDLVRGPVAAAPRSNLPFPVVGIGASAEGLRALTELFNVIPPDCGMSFVIVLQQLLPLKESSLQEVLPRHTGMPVREIVEGMRVEPNCVYVLRPSRRLTIASGHLHLSASLESESHQMDDFFRSLAAEQNEKAIAIVLSGMGTHGTVGAQAVKVAGGICIAQSPTDAEHPEMPRSLIESGCADQVLASADIPAALMRFLHHPYLGGVPFRTGVQGDGMPADESALPDILNILRARTGRDFRGYKRPMLLRRTQRRMGLAAITDLAHYAAKLRGDSHEAVALADDIAINVTGFFRDEPAWEALREKVVRPLVASLENRAAPRAWAAGCSSGEEAYGLAILIAEEADRVGKTFDVRIFATDTAEKTLARARAGVYPAGIEADVNPRRIERFFERDGHSLRVRKSIRDMVVFAPQNLLSDPPFSRLDIVACRNVLIYLEPETQRHVLELLQFALRADGVLFLGSSETPHEAEGLFAAVDAKSSLYRCVRKSRQSPRASVERHRTGPANPPPVVAPLSRPNLSLLVQRALVEEYAPVAVAVDRQGKVLYIQGDVGRYLAYRRGAPSQELGDVVRQELRTATQSAVRQAMRENRSITVADSYRETDQSVRVTIRVSPVRQREASEFPSLFLVAFTEVVPGGVETQARIRELEDELRTVREELHRSIEQLESSNQELRAASQEVSSINEELQSAVEELETNKEELQSLNEELNTVNTQLQVKLDELESSNSDLANLLGSTNIAVLFLDTMLRVRRFTPPLRDLLGLISSDIGRPIEHMAQKFTGGNFVEDAQRALEDLVPIEAEVSSSSGRSYIRRILPYRIPDNRVAGIVVTFFDITERKRAEESVRAAQARLHAIVEQMPAAVLVAEVGADLPMIGNREAAALFGCDNANLGEAGDWRATLSDLNAQHPDGRPYSREDWPIFRSMSTGDFVRDEEIVCGGAHGTRRTVLASSAPVRDSQGRLVAAVATFAHIGGSGGSGHDVL
jgi:two-component system, chemotaxis family, CheB/CheR fusion protein